MATKLPTYTEIEQNYPIVKEIQEKKLKRMFQKLLILAIQDQKLIDSNGHTFEPKTGEEFLDSEKRVAKSEEIQSDLSITFDNIKEQIGENIYSEDMGLAYALENLAGDILKPDRDLKNLKTSTMKNYLA